MSATPPKPGQQPAIPPLRPMGCGMFTGILFSRKRCPNEAVTTCARCETPLCKSHVRAPLIGRRFLCPNCDAYENDDDWRYSNGRWRYRYDDDFPSATARGAAAGTVAGAAAGQAQAGDLTDEDRRALSTNAQGEWQGNDPDPGQADDTDDSGSDMDDDGGFDAS